MDVDAVTGQIIAAAMRVHSSMGPGLLESVYETCLVHEIRKRGLRASRQVAAPLIYDGIQLDAALRLDLLVENAVAVEVKAVEKLTSVHTAQLLSYLRLGDWRVGLLINFQVVHLRDGVKRVVSGA